jgi:hypothetical protein
MDDQGPSPEFLAAMAGTYRSEERDQAIRRIKEEIDEISATVIWLHDPDTGDPLALMMREHEEGRRPDLDTVEEALMRAGWDPMDHAHIGGEAATWYIGGLEGEPWRSRFWRLVARWLLRISLTATALRLAIRRNIR